MLKLAGRRVDVVLDAGVLGFDGWGWPPEWLAILTGRLRPKQLAAISKTLTYGPNAGNFRWWKPWGSIRYLGGGNYVNKMGLPNPGLSALKDELGLFCRRVGVPIISVLPPHTDGAGAFAYELAKADLGMVAVEINASCPNYEAVNPETLPDTIAQMREYLRCPLIVKMGAMGSSERLARAAIELEPHVDVLHIINTVPYSSVFPLRKSPLATDKNPLDGGGVSGPAIHSIALLALMAIRTAGFVKPIICGGGISSLIRAQSMARAGADAVAIGTAIRYDPALAHRIAEELQKS